MNISTIKLNTVVKRASGPIVSELDNEVVMMSIEQGEYYGLGQIGSDIWRILEQPMGVNDIIVLLIKQYEVCFAQCQQDVLTFLNQLQHKGLIALAEY